MSRKHAAVRKARPPYLAFSRETDLTRQVELREEFRSVLIATNGKGSEIDYFQSIKAESWVNAGKVIIRFVNGDPVSLVVSGGNHPRRKRLRRDMGCL